MKQYIHALIRKKRWLPDIVLIIFLLGLTFYTWSAISKLYLYGDGMVYFVESARGAGWSWDLPTTFANFELGSLMTASLLVKLFGVNFSAYYWFEIAIMMVIAVLFYFLVKTITKNRLIAFSAALILSVNYFGSWDIYVSGSYSMFLGRIMEMVLLIPSFMFLHLYLEKSKLKYYLTSIILFFASIGLSHWFFFFTFPYVAYPVFWQLFKKRSPKRLIISALVGLSYAAISVFFMLFQEIQYPGWGRTWTFTEFALNPQLYQYPEKVARQLVYLSSYPNLFKGITTPSLSQGSPIQYFPDVIGSIAITPQVLVAYLLVFGITYFKFIKRRALLLTLAAGTLSVFYLNAYLNRYDILNNASPNRYLYLGTVLLSIFWSLFLGVVFFKGARARIFLGLVVLGIYYLVNTWLIFETFKLYYPWQVPTIKVFDHIKKTRPMLAKNTLVITPYDQAGDYEVLFLTYQLGKGEVRYMHDKDIKMPEVASSSGHVIKLTYDKNCTCVLEEKIKQ